MTAPKLRLQPRRTHGVPLFVLLTSASLGGDRRAVPPELFASEVEARRRFQRLRLEVGTGAGWAQLMVVEGDDVRPLCWFGPADTLTRHHPSRERTQVMSTTQLAPEEASAPSFRSRTSRRRTHLWRGVLVAGTLAGTMGVHTAIDDGRKTAETRQLTIVSPHATGSGDEVKPVVAGPGSETSDAGSLVFDGGSGGD